MVATQKNYSAAFKLKAVVEILKGKKTVTQLAAELGVAPTLLSDWKHHFIANGAQIFENSQHAQSVGGKPEKIELFHHVHTLKSSKVLLKKKVG